MSILVRRLARDLDMPDLTPSGLALHALAAAFIVAIGIPAVAAFILIVGPLVGQ